MSEGRKPQARFQVVEVLLGELAERKPPRSPAGFPQSETAKRPKTRLLGAYCNQHSSPPAESADAAPTQEAPKDGTVALAELTVIDGPGRGSRFTVFDTYTRIGRGDGQEVQLCFGDDAVSRNSHAVIAYYGPITGFRVRDGKKANPVFLNGRLLHGDQSLLSGDLISIGETTLHFCVSRPVAI